MIINGYEIRPGADLQFADFQGADLRNVDLRNVDLRDADLQGADLKGADLKGADLQDADLRGADLQFADLRGANLDFSSWPLWCGSYGVNIDERLAKQLIHHALAVALPHIPKRGVNKTLLDWANGFHHVGEVGKLKKDASNG